MKKQLIESDFAGSLELLQVSFFINKQSMRWSDNQSMCNRTIPAQMFTSSFERPLNLKTRQKNTSRNQKAFKNQKPDHQRKKEGRKNRLQKLYFFHLFSPFFIFFSIFFFFF